MLSQDLADKAAELLAQDDRSERAENLMFELGYHLGLTRGYDLGYDDAEADMAREWAAVAERVRRLAKRTDPAPYAGSNLTGPELIERARRSWGVAE